jgi:hypothetical protein
MASKAFLHSVRKARVDIPERISIILGMAIAMKGVRRGGFKGFPLNWKMAHVLRSI